MAGESSKPPRLPKREEPRRVPFAIVNRNLERDRRLIAEGTRPDHPAYEKASKPGKEVK